MSLQERLDAAKGIIIEHNSAFLAEGSHSDTLLPGQIDFEKFSTLLKASGATTEDRLKSLSHEDILECLPSYEGVKPRLVAKDIAKVFRGKDDSSSLSSDKADKKPVSSKHAERMSVRELVETFDPENADNSVGQVLGRISKGNPFIVYSSGRIVDVESTIKLLSEIKQGFGGRNDYNVNGVPVKVYKLGELPDNFADENPLWANRPLRPDGTCDQMGRSWEGVGLDVRQMIRLAVDLGEIEVNISNAHDVLDMALEATAMNKLRSRYRKASLKYDELLKIGKLPTLKLTLVSPSACSSKDVLRDGKKVVWVDPNMVIAKDKAIAVQNHKMGYFMNSNSYYKASK